MPPITEGSPPHGPTLSRAQTIGVFAPGGYDPDPTRLARARGHFAANGARVVDRLTVGGHWQRFAGTDDERLGWLRAVVDDPTLDIAMALRGGYGATPLLPRIDFATLATAIRTRGLRLVGHSDVTAIELALLARTGAISFAGPMASYDFGGDAVDPFTGEHFWRAMREARVDATFEVPEATTTVSVAGTLWGGNLTMLTSLIGTPWMPAVDGGVLFIEDINEQPYRIERMLFQLQQAGVLDRQRLVLCGDFSGIRAAEYDDGYGVPDAIARVQRTTAVPLVAGLPFGHCPQKLTLAIGAPCIVEVDAGRCRLRQQWDLAAT